MLHQAYMQGRSRLRCKDGDEVWLEYVAGEVEVDGRPLYVSIGRAEFAE